MEGSGLNHSEAALLKHAVRLMGLRGPEFDARLRVLLHPPRLEQVDLDHTRQGGLLFAVRPSEEFCKSVGVTVRSRSSKQYDFPGVPVGKFRTTLRTLHNGETYVGAGQSVLQDLMGEVHWLYVQFRVGGILLIGTDLGKDIVRFRQGDPSTVKERRSEAMWGIEGERPVFLFEHQLAGLSHTECRQSDFWSMFAAEHIAEKVGLKLAPVLPGGAVGAVVVTGDDDQASLDKYAEQLALLAGQPITYFLHPLTRHTSATMLEIFGRNRVEIGIHPDSLDAPHRYAERLADQCGWFQNLASRRPVSLRNHGFLNEGYWGHLQSWLHEGIRISSNLPGIDGRPLNGSFLPAKLSVQGTLVDHWSVVTAVGDGVRYIDGGRSDNYAASCIYDTAESIRDSGIPGLIVLNLHPQNVADTRLMHLAAIEVIGSGFLPWTMQDCLDWFADGLEPAHQSGRGLRNSIKNAIAGWRNPVRAIFAR